MMLPGDGWFIAIEGNLGAGKTTLARYIATDLDAVMLAEEFEENSFLPKFYEEPERHAFPLELSFLAARFNQLKSRLNQSDLFHSRYISDYCLFRSQVFSRITLNDDEYSLYSKLYEIMEYQVRKPDLVVYLHRPVPVLMDLIKKRGRSYEANIQASYLEKVQEAYLQYFRSVERQSILILELGSLDFEKDMRLYDEIKTRIFTRYRPGIHRVRL